MVLVKTSDIKTAAPSEEKSLGDALFMSLDMDSDPDLVPFKDGLVTKHLGKIQQGKQKHYYSDGNFNLVRLIFHLLKQIGPSDIFIATYSISQETLEAINSRISSGLIRNIRFIIDNRVKVMSPIPFQLMKESFNYRCISLHAKVALIENDQWKISIVTSQNATNNPKLERGVIYTDNKIFDFDKNILEDAYSRGTD